MASIVAPFRRSYRSLQWLAHERPVIFFSLLIGISGPVLAFSVPPIRRNYFGYVQPELIPTTYPLPQRPRRPVKGYDDE
ncbi:hypothetical protein PISMIDRAFT_689672 [Pisolithus microcarpus 441]|uniref:NADH-ubiquinone oxidoreductase 9.5 kDa subunit n=1 Tax=Pisolithus microcarpus 441 TaxID=765257 RepID=A0A0C9YEA1_9AGAM|nr:hypothetical protein BKA83DRAFT_4253086 [Pisolithus microcarpus]KIK12204.1 hypothetical protein PISMIDRAFT_689672 [Pisolithus microcarpus 441]